MPANRKSLCCDQKRPVRIVAGSYERLLYGLDAVRRGDQYELSPAFMYPAHRSAIKCVAGDAEGRFLATGSTDETIRVYDARRKREIGSLVHHDGAVTALQFAGTAHLLSGSEDGRVTMWRTKDWAELKTLSGHKGAVRDMALHPQGGVLLTVGADGTLKCWDIVNGKLAYSIQLDAPAVNRTSRATAASGETVLVRDAASDQSAQTGAERGVSHAHSDHWRLPLGTALRIAWVASGDRFAIMFDRGFKLYDVATGDVAVAVVVPTRLCALVSLGSAAAVAVGGDDAVVRVFSSEDGRLLSKFESGHPQRIKDMAVLEQPQLPAMLASVSSDGLVLLWDLAGVVAASGAVTCAPLARHDTGVRLTCVAVCPLWQKKRRAARQSGAVDEP